MQRILKFEIDNEIVEIGKSPYFFDSVSGLSNTSSEISSSTVILQDGIKVHNITAKERVISITGRIRGKDRKEAFELRRQLIHTFSAKRGIGKLTVTYSDGTEYYIEAIAENGVEITEQNASEQQANVFEFSIDLLCPYSFFKQEEVFETHFTQINPMWSFEMSIDVDDENSFIFGDVYHKNSTTLDNKGDVPSGFYCKIEGTITDWFLLKHLDKDKEIRIENVDFKKVKSIDIYSQTGNKKVYINYTDGRRELAYKYMSINSEFFELSAGKNNIYFETNSKDVDLNVSLEYKSLFAGI